MELAFWMQHAQSKKKKKKKKSIQNSMLVTNKLVKKSSLYFSSWRLQNAYFVQPVNRLKTQKYLIVYNVKLRKEANCPICETGYGGYYIHRCLSKEHKDLWCLAGRIRNNSEDSRK